MERRSLRSMLVLAGVLGAGLIGRAQAVPVGDAGETAAVELPLQYTAMRANAPPGQCGCFWMQGGSAGAVVNLRHGFSAVGDVALVTNRRVNSTLQSLFVVNYLFGPRYSWRTRSRYTPYAQVLVGGSRVSSNFPAYSTGDSYLAYAGGGGVQVAWKPHVSFTAIDARWVHSSAVNGTNNRQNNLQLGAGVVLRFGRRG